TAVGRFHACPTAGQHVRVGGGEVDVVSAAAIARSAIARCDAHGYSHSSRGLEGLVEGVHRLRSPRGLGTAPADRDYCGVVLRIMNRSGDRVEKALIRVRRKVHRDVSGWSDRAGYLDIEHYFAVGPVRIARRMILAVVDRDGRDLRQRNTQSLKISLEVCRT